jgi:tRNA A-37 threonylcarbamoyl transferase component Bud32
MTGRQLEKYTLLEEVGQGGMAVVYRGVDTVLDREVAVKILHPHLAKEEESKQRFQREAHAVAKLRHDNILEIFDYSGLDSDESYIVTEFIHGQTLKDFLARNPISHPEIAAMLLVEVCKALGHAHGTGIIHRDIKPENIMIRRDGRVKLMDFGIAQMVDVQKLTVTGQLLGSPAYMAPELVQGRPLDFRSDVFSLGTLLYQLCTGELPFKGRNPHEVLKRIADGNFVTPEVANPVVDSKMGRIVRKALAHEPDARYQQVDGLREALMAFLADVDIDSPRKELAAYFADTAAYSRSLQKRVVAALLKKGRAALAHEKGKAAALTLLDRCLCADPRNETALLLLSQISRQRRVGRIAATLAGLAVIAATTYAAARLWPNDSGQKNHADARIAVDAKRSVDVEPIAKDNGVPDSRPADQHPRPVDAKPADIRVRIRKLITIRPPLMRRVEIIPTPKAVSIWVNGRRLGDYGPDLRQITLPPGKCTITLKNPACCFDRTVRLSAGGNPKKLRLRLPWKPGRVRVVLSPAVANAVVAVGKVVARSAQLVSVPIPESSRDGKRSVAVSVNAKGFKPVSKLALVRPNQTTKIKFSLEAVK